MKKYNCIVGLCMLMLLSGIVNAQTLDSVGSRKMLIQKALEKSYEIKNAKNEVAADRFDKLKAYQTYVPNVSLNSVYTRLNDDLTFVIPPVAVELPIPGVVLPPIQMDPITLQKKESFKADVTMSMVLFTGMKVPWMIQALEHKKSADEAFVLMTEAEIIYNVVSYYDMLALVDQSQKVLTESDKRLDEEYAFVKKARKEGLINSYDESKIEIVKSQLLAKQIELTMKRKLLESLLNDLTGVDTTVLNTIHPELQTWGNIIKVSTVDNRPEVIALKEAVSANQYKTKATWSNYLPTVYTFAKKELNKDDLSALEPEWYVGAGLTWKLFDGMQNYREIQKAKLETQSAQNTYENAVSKMNVKLEKAKLNTELTNQLIVVAQKRVATAEKGLKLCIKEYEQGLISISERIEGETDYQKAQLEYIQAVYDQRIASIELLQATGNLTKETIQN
jgi:outer membrane protein TolC